jgi:hypothetical protein
MTNSLSTLSLAQLKHAVQLKEQLATLENELAALFGGAASTLITPAPAPRRRGRPPGKRAPAADAGAPPAPAEASVPSAVGGAGRSGRRRISPEGRARIIAGAKARWARFHAAKGGFKPAKATRSPASPKQGGMSRAERGRIGAAARWAKHRKSMRAGTRG